MLQLCISYRNSSVTVSLRRNARVFLLLHSFLSKWFHARCKRSRAGLTMIHAAVRSDYITVFLNIHRHTRTPSLQSVFPSLELVCWWRERKACSPSHLSQSLFPLLLLTSAACRNTDTSRIYSSIIADQ